MSARMLAYRRLMIIALQSMLIFFTYYGSFLLRMDFSLNHAMRQLFLETLAIVLGVKLIVFSRFGLLSGWWRYVGISDLRDITKAAVSSSFVIYLAIAFFLRPPGYPRSVFAIDLLLTILVICGARVLVRVYTENVKNCTAQKNTLIAGAGRAGTEIVRQLQQNPGLDYNPIGFVDDDTSKTGIKIHGIKVLGTTKIIPDVIQQYDVKCVLVAIPSARGRTVEQIVRRCREAKVEFKILQAIGTRIDGHQPSTDVRNLRVEDLLGREPVRMDLDSVRRKLSGKVLLITGAGGSIGSELCRQIAKFNPKKLVLFERSENDVFHISMDLSASFPHLQFVPVVGDILDVAVLRETFAMHRPHSVFHAAAYKHVPMMEMNCFQAVTNNVFGTYNVALISQRFEVEDFVLISTDKAVNPTSVMGVTKRISELIILGLQHDRDSRFIAVRFGNVLGSNGSVVPLFERQIASGGPVLVTHPEAKRYFMTIPEAVQLVLQASTMGSGGDIFILKMGEPVRILDLATNLIRLSGREPEREIQIVYTGLRPGEKLSEELQLQEEGIMPTSHQKVCALDCGFVDFHQVKNGLDDLARIIEMKNVHALVEKLCEMVPEYTPSKEMLALCEVDKHDLAYRYRHESARSLIVPDAA